MFQKIAIPNQRLADQVYDQILTAISTGYIGRSDRLVQEKLAEQLQVSRTPVREALLRLQQEGMLDAIGRGGFAIHVASDQEVTELYQAREAIEAFAAAELAREGTESAFRALDDLIRTVETGAYSTPGEYYDANRRIHRAFVAETKNRYLLETFDLLWNRGLSFLTFSTLSDDQMRETLKDHLALTDAIRKKVPAKAFDAMRGHIQTGMKLQLASRDDAAPSQTKAAGF